MVLLLHTYTLLSTLHICVCMCLCLLLWTFECGWYLNHAWMSDTYCCRPAESRKEFRIQNLQVNSALAGRDARPVPAPKKRPPSRFSKLPHPQKRVPLPELAKPLRAVSWQSVLTQLPCLPRRSWPSALTYPVPQWKICLLPCPKGKKILSQTSLLLRMPKPFVNFKSLGSLDLASLHDLETRTQRRWSLCDATRARGHSESWDMK